MVPSLARVPKGTLPNDLHAFSSRPRPRICPSASTSCTNHHLSASLPPNCWAPTPHSSYLIRSSSSPSVELPAAAILPASSTHRTTRLGRRTPRHGDPGGTPPQRPLELVQRGIPDSSLLRFSRGGRERGGLRWEGKTGRHSGGGRTRRLRGYSQLNMEGDYEILLFGSPPLMLRTSLLHKLPS